MKSDKLHKVMALESALVGADQLYCGLCSHQVLTTIRNV